MSAQGQVVELDAGTVRVSGSTYKLAFVPCKDFARAGIWVAVSAQVDAPTVDVHVVQFAHTAAAGVIGQPTPPTAPFTQMTGVGAQGREVSLFGSALKVELTVGGTGSFTTRVLVILKP